MGSIGSGTLSPISTSDWDRWTEDPSIYQRIERGEDLSEDFYDMYEDDWENEYAEAKSLARTIQERAESSTVNTSTLYRGERFNSLQEAERKYSVGNQVTLNNLTSYSKDKAMATSYATMYGNKVAVVITNKATEGNFVALQTHHTGNVNDPEVIVARGFTSKVTSTKYDKSKNILYVTMANSVTPKRR